MLKLTLTKIVKSFRNILIVSLLSTNVTLL